MKQITVNCTGIFSNYFSKKYAGIICNRFLLLLVFFLLFAAIGKSQDARVVVGIFKDDAFNGLEVPKSLRPEMIGETWKKIPGVEVVYLDANEIRYFSSIFKNQMDILVYPYGGYYPMESFGYYSGQSFNYFLRKGGAVITTGDIPFSKQTNSRHSLIGQYDSLYIDKAVYDKWVAKFGIEYYISAITPSVAKVNTDFLTTAAGATYQPGRIGIISNNSSHEPVPKPSNGNVFPERFPARQVIPLLQGTDQFGKIINTSGWLVQDFENGSRQILIANNAEPHLLSQSPQLPAVLKELYQLAMNKVMAKDVECAYACYKQGETVDIKGELISYENTTVPAEVKLEVMDSKKKVVYTQAEKLTAESKKLVVKKWSWKPARFNDDEYTVRMRIYRNGKLVSETENGFTVWNEEVVNNGPGISIQNEYFNIGNNQERFVSGTNYYESTRGEIMWFRPNVKNIIGDIKEMHYSGVNYIRPHYHHLKWFKDYLLYHHNKLFDFYSSLEKLEDPMPDERAWRIWDMFIYLTQKYQIIYGGDLFTLVPEDMGDPRGWWGTTETIFTKTGRAVQKKFLQQLVKRYAAVKGISWDLFNEPFDLPNGPIEDWAKDLKQTLKDNNAERLISIGGSHGISKNIIDYETPHGVPPANEYNHGGIPSLMQELHIDRTEDFEGEKDQAEAFRQQYVIVIRNGYAGICPWSWSRQMRLWQDSYEHHYSFTMEKWDDRLGLHVHDDGTYKMAGQIFKDMSVMMKKIPLKDFDSSTHKVTTTVGEVMADIQQDVSKVYHVNENHCYAAMDRDAIEWNGRMLLKGPKDAYVYAYSNDNVDLANSKQLFIKSEKPGRLLVAERTKKPVKVQLIDMRGKEQKILKDIQASVTPGGLEINVEEEFVNYWVKVQW